MIYLSVVQTKRKTNIATAVTILESVRVPGDLIRLSIPRFRALVVSDLGPYENIPAYAEMDQCITENKLVKTYVLEQHFSDPSRDTDPAKWRTESYYSIK